MAKTYDPAQLATSQVYQVRFLIGDTLVGTPPAGPVNRLVLDDAEIAWLLTREANVYMAAAAAAETIVQVINAGSTGNGLVTRKRVGQTDISYANGKTAEDYSALAKQLRARSGHQIGFAGGISASDKLTREQDTDRPVGRLRLGQFDSPIAADGRQLLDQ